MTVSAAVPPVIAIDGPTASGKGTVAAGVAEALGFHMLDSGALYRLVALRAEDEGAALDDEHRLAALAGGLEVHFAPGRIFMGDREVSAEIRSEDVGLAASRVAAFGAVRQALVARQRAFRRPPGLVADGRDMGTVIFPDAALKVFLTASVEARAARRHKQLMEKGFPANIDSLSADLAERDARDMHRAESPLKPAEDARRLDTSGLTVEDTVRQVLRWWESVRGAAG